MSNIICILDTCSILNLLSIDEDDLLWKSISKHLDIIICEKVVGELRVNAFKKDQLKAKKEDVDQKLGKLWLNCIYDNTLIGKHGNNFFKDFSNSLNYKKMNGEFYSVCLAFSFSQEKSIKLFFHTDDKRAKNEFNRFFQNHQIGYIEDTADLLLLIYRFEKSITKRHLIKFLDSLYSEYATEISALLKKLRSISTDINSDRKYRKKGQLKKTLNLVIQKLGNHDFIEISDLLLEINKETKIEHILKNHSSIFHLSYKKNTNDFIKKIRRIQHDINSNKILYN